MRIVQTFTATIYVGRKNRDTGEVYGRDLLESEIQAYVNTVGLCVTVTETEFIYSNGKEPGFAIGLINYPRFPATEQQIKAHAIAIAAILKDAYKQFKVSILMPSETLMIETPDPNHPAHNSPKERP